MRVTERPFSDLLRRPKDVTTDVEEGDVLLRRRDEPDLRLSRADRDADRAAAFAALGRTLRNLAVHSPKRRERVAQPPKPSGWDFRYATSDAVSGWEKVCAAAPGRARTAWEQIITDPRERSERQHPLKGTLGTRLVSGENLEQWQYEV